MQWHSVISKKQVSWSSSRNLEKGMTFKHFSELGLVQLEQEVLWGYDEPETFSDRSHIWFLTESLLKKDKQKYFRKERFFTDSPVAWVWVSRIRRASTTRPVGEALSSTLFWFVQKTKFESFIWNTRVSLKSLSTNMWIGRDGHSHGLRRGHLSWGRILQVRLEKILPQELGRGEHHFLQEQCGFVPFLGWNRHHSGKCK